MAEQAQGATDGPGHRQYDGFTRATVNQSSGFANGVDSTDLSAV